MHTLYPVTLLTTGTCTTAHRPHLQDWPWFHPLANLTSVWCLLGGPQISSWHNPDASWEHQRWHQKQITVLYLFKNLIHFYTSPYWLKRVVCAVSKSLAHILQHKGHTRFEKQFKVLNQAHWEQKYTVRIRSVIIIFTPE